ncbi:UNVERIFIED_CONTAM: hypothetical protein Slati_0428900 [Sesamum latifolium]|uniref:Uncharacterized protein n=1 Tax=Sesamum latifolium TaxID=2727402 RepID=A0AAW2XVL0_9LAMI
MLMSSADIVVQEKLGCEFIFLYLLCFYDPELLGIVYMHLIVQSCAAFVLRHPLVASAVFGATKLWQLQDVLDGCRVHLTPEIVAEINKVHSAFPNPCP